MDKQTYEELYNTTRIITSSYKTAMEQIFEEYELDGVHENIQRLHDFIESQVPLEIVVGNLYRCKKTMYVNDGSGGSIVLYEGEIVLLNAIECGIVKMIFVMSDKKLGKELYTFDDQINVNNFMKVESK